MQRQTADYAITPTRYSQVGALLHRGSTDGIGLSGEPRACRDTIGRWIDNITAGTRVQQQQTSTATLYDKDLSGEWGLGKGCPPGMLPLSTHRAEGLFQRVPADEVLHLRPYKGGALAGLHVQELQNLARVA